MTDLASRAAKHAALGEPTRLAIVDDLTVSDRSPKELAERHGLATNLLAHHLDVLEGAGLITRCTSNADRRRRYVQLVGDSFAALEIAPRPRVDPVMFVCTHNSARSPLAAAVWTARTGQLAMSGGTHPAERVHRGAVDAAHRAGLDIVDARPTAFRTLRGRQVVTVCDQAHEALHPGPDWWHWSLADPVEQGTATAFDDVIAEIELRISRVVGGPKERTS